MHIFRWDIFNDQVREKFFNNHNLNKLPDVCPVCNYAMVPIYISAIKTGNKLTLVVSCPRHECQEISIHIYETEGGIIDFFTMIDVIPKKAKYKVFDDEIEKISPNFVEIYNQSVEAESLGLNQVSGVGYRKALEYLVKDYLIHLYPEQQEKIKAKYLGNCIKDHIENPKIKTLAERAAWLGNDETHYTRIWVDKDVNDLKVLIELTARYISSELYSEKIVLEMPQRSKQ
ncbi:DUF4145 domain-containing protein [Brevibacillus thermoruber]|uniref:DUF4145 domain-containing protein n=1 Tax=Brevibacillus thermoruber TaxID=33942 RepID=UPI00048DA38F|nr:DUF4145 domain-containing protein [Brevibacillus thermoruber]